MCGSCKQFEPACVGFEKILKKNKLLEKMPIGKVDIDSGNDGVVLCLAH